MDPDQKDVSVLDILYADYRRISTFIAQFNDFGNLTGITQSRRAGRGKSNQGALSASGNVFLAKGESSLSSGTTAQYEEQSERSYDPRWTNTLAFLDEIESRGLLSRDLLSAKLGDLVLHKGPMRIRDLALLGKVWSLPSVRAFTKSGKPELSRQQRRAQDGKGVLAKDQPNEIDLAFELISVLPHAAQAQFGSETKSWCLLEENSLNVSASDFVLMNGGKISGEWGVVGIMDAKPNNVSLMEGIVPSPPLSAISDVMLMHIEPLTRQLLGRPDDCYGLTPLVIFRVVG